MIRDDAIPDLARALDPAQAARWLGADHVERAARRDTKYAPGVRCVVAHELLVGGVAAFVAAVADPDGLTYSLAVDDPALPNLRTLLDPRQLGDRLRRDCTATLIRYKPLTRAVVRVEIPGEAGLIAKCLAEAPAAAVPDLPELAAPIAWWADWSTQLVRTIPGRELHALLGTGEAGEAGAALSAAGACLARLHAARVPAPPRTMADDLAELDTYRAPMTQADPPLAARYERLLDVLRGLGPGGDPVPSHGALRTDAFLLGPGGGPVMIDLDGFCLAEPARDVGNLLAYLDWRSVRGKAVPDPSAFLAAYGTLDPVRLAAYHTGSLLKIAGRRYRSLSWNEWPLVPDLLDRAVTTADTLPNGHLSVRE